MKKHLLRTLFIFCILSMQSMGTQITTDIKNGETTEMKVPVRVTGRVIEPVEKTLVVEIKDSANADNSGFLIEMPDLVRKGFNQVENEKKTKEAQFEVKILENGKLTILDEKSLNISLEDGNGTNGKEIISTAKINSGEEEQGDEVHLIYNVLKTETGSTAEVYAGKITVGVTSGDGVGSYTDTSVRLKVEVSGESK